jgi:hypothetical protein
LEAELRFRFRFQRLRLDFFLNSAVEKLSNRNSDSEIWNSKKKQRRNSVHLISYQKNGCRYTYIYSTLVATVPASTQCLSRHTYIYSTPVSPYLHLLNACPAIPTSTQCLSRSTQKKRRECFLIHEIGRIDGRRGFRTGRNVFQIGRNTFYDQKNKILMKIPGSKGPESERLRNSAEFRADFPTKS